MNNENQQDEKWKALLALSAPTFTGGETLPYGFATRTLARLRAEKGEREIAEKVGLRALFASIVMLVAVAVISLNLQLQDRFDVDPSVISVMQMEKVSVS